MKKSMGFSIAAIVLTALYALACVEIFANGALVYEMFGLPVRDTLLDPSLFYGLGVRIFLNVLLVLLFAVGALLCNPRTEKNNTELILLVLAVVFQCLQPVCNIIASSYETVVIARTRGAEYLAAYSTMINMVNLAGMLLTVANAMALLQIGINYGRKKKNQ